MSANILCLTSCSVTFELQNHDVFFAKEGVDVSRDGIFLFHTDRNVFTVYDLVPGSATKIQIGEETYEINVPEVSYVVHSNDFLLEKRGEDDTLALQTAIYMTPEKGLLIIDEGEYHVRSLFLKSNITIYFKKGARLLASTKVEDYPTCIPELKSPRGELPMELFSWEGSPFPGKPSILTGYQVHDVNLVGEGFIEGRADEGVFWEDVKNLPYGRPRLLFLNHCENINVVGLSFRNTPCWTIHPFFSDHLGFYDLYIENPKDSPNTDGMDPESCRYLEIIGVRFSVGDDCIALKSGKMEMGKTFLRPTEHVLIRNCYMNEGHGAIVLGSEVGAGLRDLKIERCFFRHTDRGLRIKTRRGRGKDSVIDDVLFEDIRMENVLTPFTINMFYFCDPDGKSDYVQNRAPRPVDDSTPRLGKFTFRRIEATDAEVALGYFIGLPEQPIGEITIVDSSFSVKEDAVPSKPAMLCGVEDMAKQGFLLENVQSFTMENVQASGFEGELVTKKNVGEVTY